MNITIVGGGNIGTLMAAEAASKGNNVTVYTSKPDKWHKSIDVYDSDDNLLITSNILKATNDMKIALKDADYILITVPAQIFPKIAKKIEPYIKEEQSLGIIPGFGGAEFAFSAEIEKGCTFFGLQRVHSIARLKEYGKSVYQLGRKKQIEIGVIPSYYGERVGKDISDILDMPCKVLANYLSVTLTPSNPIFHTSRLYSLFKNWNDNVVYPRNYLFHEEWDDDSSEVMIACDNELQKLCDRIPLDLSSVESLQDYYESHTSEEMTRKIRSIKAFKGLKSPMIRKENGWIPDWNSRYFTADFNYGIKVIKDIANLFNVSTPMINKIWDWYYNAVKLKSENFFEMDTEVEVFLNMYRQRNQY